MPGAHNRQNLLLVTAAATEIGLNAEQIVQRKGRTVKKLKKKKGKTEKKREEKKKKTN